MSNPGIQNDNYAHKTGVNSVCVNDVDKSVRNEFLYNAWGKMLNRVFKKYNSNNKLNVTVCNDWLALSNFIKWGESQDYNIDSALDKDIIVIGNRHYSPKTCCFVSQQINNLIKGGISKHNLMQGVRQGKSQIKNKKYCSQIGYKGSYIHLGTFDNEIDAHNTYRINKAKFIRLEANLLSNKIVSDALIKHAELYEDLSCTI